MLHLPILDSLVCALLPQRFEHVQNIVERSGSAAAALTRGYNLNSTLAEKS